MINATEDIIQDGAGVVEKQHDIEFEHVGVSLEFSEPQESSKEWYQTDMS